MKKIDKNFLRIIIAGIILIAVYKFIDNLDFIVNAFGALLKILTPIIIGAVIAFFTYRPTRKVASLIAKSKNKRLKKAAPGLGILIVYFIIFGIIVLFFKYMIPLIVKNIQDLVYNAPKYYAILMSFISKNEYLANATANLNLYEKLIKYINTDTINHIVSVLTFIANSFIKFFLSIVLSIYFILERDTVFRYAGKIKSLFFKKKSSGNFSEYFRKIINIFYSYFTGMALDAVIMGTASGIILAIFKVPYAVLLGLIVAFGNMIPFFGSIVSAIIEYIVGALAFGFVGALWIPVMQFVLGQLDGNIIQPRILGHSVGLSPLIVLMSVIIFGDIFGPVGMILGVPVVASLKIVLSDYLKDKEMSLSADPGEPEETEEG